MLHFNRTFKLILVGCLVSVGTLLSSCNQENLQPKAPRKYQIFQGAGLNTLKIGDTSKTFLNHFGGSERQGSVVALDQGIEVNLRDGRIITIFFHFIPLSSSQGIFDGETFEGVNVNSKPREVIDIYGKPENDFNRTGPLLGNSFSVKERSIEYPSKGINFVFWDEKLARILVYK